MGRRTVARSPCVSVQRINALNNLNIGRGDLHPVAARNPVLRARMAVSELNRRELGNDIVGMRGAVEGTLGGDVFGKRLVAHAGAAVCILCGVSIQLARQEEDILPVQLYNQHSARPSPPKWPLHLQNCVQ